MGPWTRASVVVTAPHGRRPARRRHGLPRWRPGLGRGIAAPPLGAPWSVVLVPAHRASVRPAWLQDYALVQASWARLGCLMRLLRNRLFAASGSGATHPSGVSCLSADPCPYRYDMYYSI